MTIFLDAGILGLLAHRYLTEEVRECAIWLRKASAAGHEIVISEINDYELRRSLIRIKSLGSLNELDALIARYTYLPISTSVMRRAAALWAETKNSGLPLAHPQALDCDVILLAQVSEFHAINTPIVIATTDVSDLNRYADARLWQEIEP